MFNGNSIIVKTWVNLVENGTYNREEVPKLSNLQTVVYGILDAEEGA
jgi:hypothetical protein